MKKQRLLIASLLISISCVVQAQPRNVTGVIKSDIDGKPIEGVEIRLKGDATTAKSNENGNYSIVVDQKSTETLIFSHPDFEEMEVVVIGKSNLDLTLTSNIRLNQYGQPVERESLSPKREMEF